MENVFLKKYKKQKHTKKKKIQFNSGNFSYVCTRVKARRSFFLTDDIYSRLLVMDIAGITRFLGENQYKKEINEIIHKYSDEESIEFALNKNLANSYNQILEFSKGNLQNMIKVYLDRYNIWNIKTVIRGKQNNASLDEIMKVIIPLGKTDENYWKFIYENSNSVDELIENLRKNELYPLLIKSNTKFSEDPFKFENLLEIEYYNYLLNSITGSSKAETLYLDLIKSEIDLINLKTLFISKYDNIESDKVKNSIIPNSNIPADELKILSEASDFKHFLNLLQKHSFYKLIKDEIKKFEESGDIDYIIRVLEKEHILKSKKFSYIYPLSILPIIDYFIRKKIEIDNLRIIAKGKRHNFSEKEIKEMLVISK